ncbi:hypothetical protein HRbin16_03041 [bacterium HR16]|nr:hypothetical protein HRbin16_03041 [bacterium HR16]
MPAEYSGTSLLDSGWFHRKFQYLHRLGAGKRPHTQRKQEQTQHA